MALEFEMMKKIIFLLFLSIFSVFTYGQDADQDEAFLGNEKQKSSLEIILQKANKGDVSAQSYLARIYANGWGVEKDLKKAAIWAEKGAQNNDPASQNILGDLYFYGLANYPVDKEKGIRLTTAAVDHDYGFARDKLSRMVFDGKTAEQINEIENKLKKDKSISSAQLLQDLYRNHRYKPANVYKMLPYGMEAFKRGGYSSGWNIVGAGEYVQYPPLIQAGWLKIYLETGKVNSKNTDAYSKQLRELVNSLNSSEVKELESLKLGKLIDLTNSFLKKRQLELGQVEAIDLINEGWEQFVGKRGIVNEPLAQYLLEEGLRKSILIQHKYLMDVARNNLGVVLGAAVNKNVRNKRLAQVHIVDGGESEFGPDNLIWYAYEGKITLSNKEMDDLFERYKEVRGEDHILKKLGPLPVELKNKPASIIKYLQDIYSNNKEFQNNYQLAEQIADMYEDNYFDLDHLKEARKWYEKRNALHQEDEDDRLARINLVIEGRYVKDTPNLKNAINDVFEIREPQESQSLKKVLEVRLPSDQKLTTSRLNVSALVVGNSSYPISSLANATNDAKLMADKFKSFGYNVTYVTNLSRKAFVKSLMDFSEKSKDADVTILYYSGHGMQLGGVNYLLPIDIDLKGSEDIVALDGISLNDIERRYMPGKSRLIFLDACRSKPFKVSQTRGGDTGLAPVNVSRGTLISFATKDGGVAFDGAAGKNSPYTGALAIKLDDKEDISLVLRSVRDEVVKVTQGKQEPWEYGSLSGGKLVLSSIAAQ
jgi:TPR repeat protein